MNAVVIYIYIVIICHWIPTSLLHVLGKLVLDLMAYVSV
jgi:hypothetical protein